MNSEFNPTLFIGLGGSGKEVLLRGRQQILNTMWGNANSKNRIESLLDFPLAQFIYFDLDPGPGDVTDIDKDQIQDLQFDKVKFSDDEMIVEIFDIDKYLLDEDTFDSYAHLKDWSPITPDVCRSLGKSPRSIKARAISRVCLFDKLDLVRNKIRTKILNLKAGLSHEKKLNRLGLKGGERIRIVVVGSVAGVTGSGSFLDFGWLCTLEDVGMPLDVELMLFLPTGYSTQNKESAEGNGYAALMELEAAMRGDKQYLGSWVHNDIAILSNKPYQKVYLIDSGNLAQLNTSKVTNLYDMLAEKLFGDFASGDLAHRKRTLQINQYQHLVGNFHFKVDESRFKGLRIPFSQSFSSFGLSSLDTRLDAKVNQKTQVWAGAILRAYLKLLDKDIDYEVDGTYAKVKSLLLRMLQEFERDAFVLEENLKNICFTSVLLPFLDKEIPLPSDSTLIDWAEDIFKDFGGSMRGLIALQEPYEIKNIFHNIKRMAEYQIRNYCEAENRYSNVDPLIEALENMAPNTLEDAFTKFLIRAMPWVDTDISKFHKDKFRCIVGVPNAFEFKRRFESKLNDCLPDGLSYVDIVSTGISGRAVCYVELSGIPLCTLRGLEGWRSSYRKQLNIIPLHTHKDITRFIHPVAPSPVEINMLADDIKYFLLAIMLGKIVRIQQNVYRSGQYQFEMEDGIRRSIGNERHIRQNGFGITYRQKIVEKINESLAGMDASSLFALTVLCEDYEQHVYPPKAVTDDFGSENFQESLYSFVLREIVKETFEKVQSKGLHQSNFEKYRGRLITHFSDWTESIPNSEQDPYPWEIKETEENGIGREKYTFKAEFLAPGKIAFLINSLNIAESIDVLNAIGVPPTIKTIKNYHLAVNKVVIGVFNSLEILTMCRNKVINTSETLVWTEGLENWVDFESFDEFKAFGVNHLPKCP
jgi:hypothetical protein